MQGLENLLKNLRNALNKGVVTKEIITKNIQAIAHVTVETTDVFINGDTIRIKTSPTKRNIIKLEEDKILLAVRRETRINFQRLVY